MQTKDSHHEPKYLKMILFYHNIQLIKLNAKYKSRSHPSLVYRVVCQIVSLKAAAVDHIHIRLRTIKKCFPLHHSS